MAQLPDNVLELLRSQVPQAGTDLPSNALIVFLEELLDRIAALETEVAALP